MLAFKKLYSPDYLFTINRLNLDRSDRVLFSMGVIFVVLAIVFKLAALWSLNPIDKKYRQKFFSLFLTIGLLEIVWFGARYQNVRFFGSHFVALILLVIGFVWGIMLLIKIYKGYKPEIQIWEKEQVKLKYLPK